MAGLLTSPKNAPFERSHSKVPLLPISRRQTNELEQSNVEVEEDGSTAGSKTTKEVETTTSTQLSPSAESPFEEQLCSADCKRCRSSGLGPPRESRPKLLARHSGADDTNSTPKRDWEFVDAPKIVEISRDADGKSTSEMARLEDSFLTMGQLGLYGCSSVVVVSKYAVYMSHLYEIPSFTAFKNGKDARDGFIFVESEFKKRVSDFLDKGELKNPEFTGSKKFPNPSTQAIIISPKGGSKDAKFKYTKLVNRISEELTRALKLPQKPVIQSYSVDGDTSEKDDNLGDSAPDGKLVFEYIPKGREPAKDCKTNSTVALFMGDPEHGKEYPIIFTSHWMRDVHDGKCPEAATTTIKAEAAIAKELGPKPTGFDCKGSPVCGGVPGFDKDKDSWWKGCDMAVAELNDEEYYGTRDDNKDTGGCGPRAIINQMPACGVFVEGDNCQVKGKYFKE
ncbi:hypothetical protein FQN54_008259 [Arachnomyces sp. PD_36]|nr:hypothetical protein FQN54_008259 [Arachnomyces sp. PD_36]